MNDLSKLKKGQQVWIPATIINIDDDINGGDDDTGVEIKMDDGTNEECYINNRVAKKMFLDNPLTEIVIGDDTEYCLKTSTASYECKLKSISFETSDGTIKTSRKGVLTKMPKDPDLIALEELAKKLNYTITKN